MNGDVPKFSLVKFKTLIRDTRGPADAVNEVLHTQEELDAYVASCQEKHTPKPGVAFPEERAIAVALGSRPHGGYHVEIIAVVQETGGFVGVQHHVLYVEQVPHGPATDMVTFPHHVIRLRGLGGVVSFRQVPDWFGHSLNAFAGSLAGQPSFAAPTTMATGEEAGGAPTTKAVGEEGHAPTTMAVGEEGGTGPTTMATGEEGTMPTQFTSLNVGEEHPPTAYVGEHPTTLFPGEEGPTLHIGEHPTTLVFAGEEGPTAHVGEHPTTLVFAGEEHLTTLMVGEETPGHGGGRGPFG